MKFLTDRRTIGQMINIDKIPVVTMEIGTCMPGYEDCYSGGKIRVAHPNGDPALYARCTIKMYGDESGNENHDAPWMYKKIELTEPGYCLSARFGFNEVMQDIEWSHAPYVKAGDKIIVAFVNSVEQTVILRVMEIGKVNIHCSTVTTLKDCE